MVTQQIQKIQVLKSAAGFYLGTLTAEGYPNSRESSEYWKTEKEAENALLSDSWCRRNDY
ncbi:MAG: hypothetical protein U5M23_13060 [Marinagarivorans sp.]|nr:hypothetical protein [Marinagarivorans sp.]